MNPSNLFKQYVQQQHMMQLATVKDGKPWVCTVYFVTDVDRNFYWASLPSRRHSQEIAANPAVSATIAIKYMIGEPVIGIQLEGQAEQVQSAVYSRIIVESYAQRFKRDEQWIEDFMTGKTEHRLYKLTPTAIFLFDEVNFPGGQRQSIL